MKKFSLTQDDKAAYSMIAPFYLFFFIFMVIPMVSGFFYSFTEYNLYDPPKFVWFKNYIKLFHDKVFIKAVWNTFLYAAFTIFPTIIFGLIIAVLLNNKKVFGFKFYRTSIYLPYIPSMASMALVWLWFYDPSTGIFNWLMKIVGGTPQKWLNDRGLALGCIILVGIWRTVGYSMIINLAGLQNIPGSLYEASRIDGANALQRFTHITVPMMKPTLFFLLVILTKNAFMVFEQVNIMTGGGPLDSTTTIVHQIYIRGFTDLKFGYSSAIAILLLMIIGSLTILNFKTGGGNVDTDVN
ncbi:MAG: sugar ABC transporter permease [Firmicutes bacterium]|nr:sugar ABC transporter permease [Bacillota bacterium]